MGMYLLTGVKKSKVDPGKLSSLAESYRALCTSSESAHSETVSAIRHVLSNNDGPAADAFEGATTGDGSIVAHLETLALQSGLTAAAYTAAAEEATSAQTAMNSIARNGLVEYLNATHLGDPVKAATVVSDSRVRLQQLESAAAEVISEAFSQISLPEPITVDDEYGAMDPEVADEYRRLAEEDPEQLKQILQNMADEYAAEHGLEPIDITWDSIESDPGWVKWGDYRKFPRRLRLNIDELDNPQLINTIIHEMEHARQYRGMENRGDPGQTVAGMDPEEAKRWRELNEKHVRDKGEEGNKESYMPRPIEVGARQAGRDHVNDLTPEEFDSYK